MLNINSIFYGQQTGERILYAVKIQIEAGINKVETLDNLNGYTIM